jgi:hypothetical protein
MAGRCTTGRCGGEAERNAGAAGRAIGGAGRAIAGGRTIAGGGAGRAIGGAAGRAIGACGTALLGSWACAPTLAAITITEAPSRKAAKRPPSGSMAAAPCVRSSLIVLIVRAINARSQESSLIRRCDFATQATNYSPQLPRLVHSGDTRTAPRRVASPRPILPNPYPRRAARLFRRDLPRRARRIGEVGRELRVTRFRVRHRLLLDRPVTANAIRQRQNFDGRIQRRRRQH